jgi:outer membrane receptor protein involved in Fe transport/Flp pilus assembly protein TadD
MSTIHRFAIHLFLMNGMFLPAVDAEGVPPQGGEIVLVENEVDRSPPRTSWTRATRGDRLNWEDQVRTGELSRAAIELSTGGVLRVSELTSLRLQPPKTGQSGERSKIDFGKGVAYFFSRTEEEADIETPTASLNIRGTEFVLEVDADGRTTVTLLDGAVGLSSELGAVDLASGEQGVVERGRAPRKTAALDASERIQWFLYYPGIVDPATFSSLARGRFARSHAAYAAGDLLGALERLPAARTAEEHRFAAAVKLASGRIDEVKANLTRAGDHPVTDSLRLLIEVVKKPSAGVADVTAPATPEGRMALSYALQSRGDLEGALKAACEAVAGSPEFGLGWARVAELEFGFGRTDKAVDAVNRALRFTPRNAQAISLQGYLALAKNSIAEAQVCFSAAIAIDPALGNAWLGQGLAFFQQRDRQAGLRSIVIAAAVEPNRAFFRSYLGKALAECRRDDRAADELRIARSIDPGDPTAPLYQALLDQRRYAFNRGIAHIEESIELNDNRAIYRSSFLLDKDRAVREANLASIYQKAGMIEASIEEARRSVVSDYVNPSAHLFLSNSINAVRDPRRVSLRNETPWFNELLIANLLAPAGSALYAQNISQQEYTDLFPSGRFGFSSRTRYLGDGEFLATGTAQGRFERTSVAFDYDIFTADGYRPNQDIERRTGYLQMKHGLTERDSIYLNLKFQDSDSGDLRQLYDPTAFDPDYRIEQEQSPVVIAGFHHEWSREHHTLALGGLLTDELRISDDGSRSAAIVFDPANPVLTAPLGFPADLRQLRETEVYFGEIQHIWSTGKQTLIVGGRFDTGHFKTTNTYENQAVGDVLPADPFTLNADPDYDRRVAYAYYTRELWHGLHATAGIAFDSIEYPANTSLPPVSNELDDTSEWLPKAGLVWAPIDELTLRLGYARALGGVTFDESVRLEPTQVAGFTQSFRTLIDESAAGAVPVPLFDTAGASVLYRFPTRTYVGSEVFLRKAVADRGLGALMIDRTTLDFTGVRQLNEHLDYQEWGGMLHINQLIGEQWAAGARYTYTRADLDRGFPDLASAGIPGFSSSECSGLHDAEAYLIWNHEDGWFSRLNARWFSQENSGYTTPLPGDSWMKLDFAVGKRFLENRGTVEIGILNLTDEDYSHNPLISLPEFPRERTVFVELRLDI